ncbi:MAG: energy-coupling factor ABC transporter permease [Clostridia bacterium]|nr:energy-coupling factor ABC transporter permease [Clostridia bacterium]
MHMADALLSPAVAAGMYAASAAAAGTAAYMMKKEEKLMPEKVTAKLPEMAVMSALVFAGQMVNYTIPGTGSSGHICGGVLLAAILGPWRAFWSLIAVLVIQCFFFADGGIMALGANIWNMAFYGCVLGYFLIYKNIMKSNMFSSSEDGGLKKKIILASLLGCVLSLQCGAFSVVVETQASGITDLPFSAFAMLMQPIHLAIGCIEGAATAAILCFVVSARPELIREASASSAPSMGMAKKKVFTILAAASVFIGGCMAYFASANPDGLEWALGNMGFEEEAAPIELPIEQVEVISYDTLVVVLLAASAILALVIIGNVVRKKSAAK